LRGVMKRRRESSAGWERLRLRAGPEVKVNLNLCARVHEAREYRRALPSYMSERTRGMIRTCIFLYGSNSVSSPVCNGMSELVPQSISFHVRACPSHLRPEEVATVAMVFEELNSCIHVREIAKKVSGTKFMFKEQEQSESITMREAEQRGM
jgi:hypothetical protein